MVKTARSRSGKLNGIISRRLHNWRKFKHSTITIESYKPTIMDENWLILEHESCFAYWNCHTQKVVKSETTPLGDMHLPLAMLGTYSYGSLPSMLYSPDAYSRDRIALRVNDKDTVLNTLNNSLNTFFRGPYTITKPIDHRVLFTQGKFRIKQRCYN